MQSSRKRHLESVAVEVNPTKKPRSKSNTPSTLKKRKNLVWVKTGTNDIVPPEHIHLFVENEIEQIRKDALYQRIPSIWVLTGSDVKVLEKDLAKYEPDEIEQISRNVYKTRQTTWIKKDSKKIIPDNQVEKIPESDRIKVNKSLFKRQEDKVWVEVGSIRVVSEDQLNLYRKEEVEEITRNTLLQREKNQDKIYVNKTTDEVIPKDQIKNYAKEDLKYIKATTQERKVNKVWVEVGTDKLIPEDQIDSYEPGQIEQITQDNYNTRTNKVCVKTGTCERIPADEVGKYKEGEFEWVTKNNLRQRGLRAQEIFVLKATGEVIAAADVGKYKKDEIAITNAAALRKKQLAHKKRGSDTAFTLKNATSVIVEKGTNKVVSEEDAKDQVNVETISYAELAKRGNGRIRVWTKTEKLILEKDVKAHADQIEDVSLSTFRARLKKGKESKSEDQPANKKKKSNPSESGDISKKRKELKKKERALSKKLKEVEQLESLNEQRSQHLIEIPNQQIIPIVSEPEPFILSQTQKEYTGHYDDSLVVDMETMLDNIPLTSPLDTPIEAIFAAKQTPLQNYSLFPAVLDDIKEKAILAPSSRKDFGN